MHLVFASAEGEEGERERRRREEGGERGREEGGEGEDSLAVCWRVNRMPSHRGESSACGEGPGTGMPRSGTGMRRAAPPWTHRRLGVCNPGSYAPPTGSLAWVVLEILPVFRRLHDILQARTSAKHNDPICLILTQGCWHTRTRAETEPSTNVRLLAISQSNLVRLGMLRLLARARAPASSAQRSGARRGGGRGLRSRW